MCAENAGDPEYRIKDTHFSDTFHIHVAKEVVNVKRLDQKTGWGLNLVIQCVEGCEKGCDEYMTGNGEDYRGCQMKTKSGHTCMTWTDPRSAPYLGDVQGPARAHPTPE